ncbi:MAG: archaeal proteasome endopeptidase complex subunit alpha [Nitrososphaerota archaeon]
MAALGMAGAYDRAITVFSPQGRLYQVEYALETVKSGSTAVGICVNEGVVLAVEERAYSKLQSPNYSQKLFQIDEHIGAASSGLISDARILVDSARVYAQIYRLTYDEPPSVEAISKRIGDTMQLYTQHAGVRPFGVALLIGGVGSDGPSLFYTEPSGVVMKYSGWSIGRGSEKVKEILENLYTPEMTLEEAKRLCIKALVKSMEKTDEKWSAKLVVIPTSTRLYTPISQEEINKLVEQALKE